MPKAKIKIEDRFPNEYKLLLSVDVGRGSPIIIGASFTYERDCGIDEIYDDNGEALVFPRPIVDLYLELLDERYGINAWLQSYLHDTDREEGRIYRSAHPSYTMEPERYDE